jgi:hypothetical protein
MSRTRAELDQKLSMLQARVSDLTPRRLTQRYVQDYSVDRFVGGMLTLIGLRMAWTRYRDLKHRRERPPQREPVAYGRWQ